MARNLDQFLAEMPISRLDVVVARAHSLASTQSAIGMKCPSCTSILVSDVTDTQRPCEVEKTGAPLPSGNLCLSCGEVGLDVVESTSSTVRRGSESFHKPKDT